MGIFFDSQQGKSDGYADVLDAFKDARESIVRMRAERLAAVRDSDHDRREAYAALKTERSAALAAAPISPLGKALAMACYSMGAPSSSTAR